MLPKAESGAFGEGFAGGVWRSMAAEQFASLFAEQGGIGVSQMLQDRDGSNVKSSAQWPYFETPSISAFQV